MANFSAFRPSELGSVMRIHFIVIAILFSALNFGCARSELSIRVWAEDGAAQDPRVLYIEDHPACLGQVALVRTNRMPFPGDGPFTGEEVVELSEDGEILHRWYMPVDDLVLGIEGDKIIVGDWLGDEVLKIGLDRSLREVATPPEYHEKPIRCPDSAREVFPNSVYTRCFGYPDLQSGKERILAYEGPCT